MLDPPCRPIKWKEITDYTILGEFDLLCHSRSDIRQERWSQPAYHEATVKYFKLCCAREEVARLNIEIRRLCTAIHDESKHVEQVIAEYLAKDDPLSLELRRLYRMRAAVNAVHLSRLSELEKLPDYMGSLEIGTQLEGVWGVEADSALDDDDMQSVPDGTPLSLLF